MNSNLNNKKNILITAGGTGGHIFPAISIAKNLQDEFNVVWVGAKSGIETTIVPKNNIPLFTIQISGLRKKGLIKKLLMPLILSRSMLQCLMILIKQRPDVVVGFGGYATFPICFMSFVLRIPVVIHEQNSIPGLTNKILSKMANYVLVAFSGVLDSTKTILVGNPVREDILNLESPEKRYGERSGGLNILVVGGSLGAKMLNDMLPEVCAKLNNISQVIHQVGRGDAASVQKHYLQAGVNAKVINFIEDMASVYATTDLIICRSGASTVSEVCNVGIASIFIPYHFAVDDHQRFNAMPSVKRGAAYMITHEELTTTKLVELISGLDREKCLKMAISAKKLAINDSVKRIADVIKKCIV